MCTFPGLSVYHSHSFAFMLGTLQAKIYNLELTEVEETKWYELKNVRYFYEFFDKNRKYFVR